LCLWFMLPSLTAKRFLAALGSEDYQSADTYFLNADDRFFADWADKRWGLRTSAELQPLTVGQFFHNRREVLVEINYFQFDQNFHVDVRLAATPFGLKKPDIPAATRLGYFFDDRAKTEYGPPRYENQPRVVVPKQ
jgi:hypothetical protein